VSVSILVGQGTASKSVTQGAEVRRYGVELDAERALIAQSKASRPSGMPSMP